MFMGDGEHEKVTILVARDRRSGATMAMWVPAKGIGHPWISRRVAVWIDALGYERVIIKSDHEESICALQREIKNIRQSETMLENSPVGESRSNGLIEMAIQEVQGAIRTLKDCVESKLIDKETGERGTTTLNGAVIIWLI